MGKVCMVGVVLFVAVTVKAQDATLALATDVFTRRKNCIYSNNRLVHVWVQGNDRIMFHNFEGRYLDFCLMTDYR